MKFSGWLAFRRIECIRCGERRVVGIPCPTCGRAPDEREVDPDRQRRQRVVAVALKALEESPGNITPPPPEPLDYFDGITALTESFLGSLVTAAEDAGRSDDVISAAAELRRTQGEAALAPRLRPWVTTWRAIEEVLERLRSAAGHYLKAMGEDNPLRAQQEARRAQQELEAAGEPAAVLGEAMERASEVLEADSYERGLAITTEQAFEQSGARDLVAFDRAGEAVYQRVTGTSGCPVGLGFGLNVVAQSAEGVFDSDRFWLVARETYSLLARDPDWLSGLLQDGAWVEDFKSSLIAAWDTAVLNEGMTAAVRRERQAVRAILDVPEGLVEGPGRIFAATLLATTKKRTYQTYRAQSAGSLLDSAHRDPGLHELLRGLDPALRRASAHQEYRLDGDGIVLMNRGRDVERLTRQELVDRVLASVESVNAVGLGMLCAAVAGGLDTDRLLDLTGELIDWETGVPLMLAANGWRGAEVSYEGDTLAVVGDAESMSLGQAAPLIPIIPEACRALRLTTTANGERELLGPVDPLRRLSRTDDQLEKQIHLMEAQRLWKRDGQPLCTDDHVRKVVSIVVMERLSEGYGRQATRLVRVASEAAERMSLDDLAAGVRSILGAIRSTATGLAGQGELDAALEPLRVWGTKRVPPLSA